MSPPAHEGIQKVGAPSSQWPCGQRPSNIFALTHPSNLREIRARIVRASSTTGSHVHEGGRRVPRRPNVLALEHAAIAQQRLEDAGEAPGEGDHGHLFPTACGDAQRPGPQLVRLRRAAAEDRDGGLNQEPAGARVAGLGDGAAALRLARAVLAGHETEIGFELMRVAEALGIVDRREEGGGGDGADARDGAVPAAPAGGGVRG